MSWNLPSPGISWASVAKLMHGSLRLNRAQDLDLKFTPWKQASEMWSPCNSIVPPRIVPVDGNGVGNVATWRPATLRRTSCQCWWCWASRPDSTTDLATLVGPLRRRLVAECRVEKIRRLLRNCCWKNSSSFKYILIKSLMATHDHEWC